MSGNYVMMLRESLEKKIEVLEAIMVANERQKEVLSDPFSTPEDLQATYDRKDELIEVLESLDKGFETMYSRIRRDIQQNKDEYSEEISKMKKLIVEISDLSASIQAEELRNKALAEAKFSKLKSQVSSVKKNKSAVNMYNQSMGQINTVDPQFMDSKN
jgi:flagellar biosynthesis/type III secretory pathway chaperone